MTLRLTWALVVICWLSGVRFGAAAVSVTVAPKTFKVEVADEAKRGSQEKGTGYYPIKGSIRMESRTVDVVTLDNGLVEAWVVPAWGGRLLRARDKATGVDYFRWEEVIQGHLGWSLPGGVKPSFPFFEHGTHLEQPAGFRIVTNADGSATVAMDMRFTQYTSPADRDRYGRFGDEALNIMVTLRPGATVVEWRQRKENPNPLPRAERMWSDAIFPVARPLLPDGREDRDAMRRLTRFVFPARYVADHGPTKVQTSPLWNSPDNWDVSCFAVDAPYGFVGVYDSSNRINRLRLNDAEGPAAKLFTSYWGDFCEYWGGVGWVFEKPGRLLPAYQPVEFTHRFWIAQGIGEVAFANADTAVAVDGTTFELVLSHDAVVTVTDATGEPVATGPAGPHAVLKGRFDGKRLVVSEGPRELLNRTFPLNRPVPVKDAVIPADVRQRFDEIVASSGAEGETVAHNEGMPGALDGVATNPRVAYRFGQFDRALALLGGAQTPEADYLRGLVAWERGEAVDFKSAGWEADYLRALQAIRKSDRSRAIALAANYVKHVPTAWYPRLAGAYWRQDKNAARTLAAENPGSPEGQLVLKLLGEPNELAALLANNPHADLHVTNFEAQLVKGEWKHLPRYPVAATGIHEK